MSANKGDPAYSSGYAYGDPSYGSPSYGAPAPGYGSETPSYGAQPPPSYGEPYYAAPVQDGYMAAPASGGYATGPYGDPNVPTAQPAIGSSYAPAAIIFEETGIPEERREWQAGLCDCLDDFPICLCGTFCCGFQTAITKARIENREAEATDHCLGCIMCILSCGFGFWCCQSFVEYQSREEIGKSFKFPERSGANMFTSLCCLPCVVCQHAREVKKREKLGDLPPLQKM
eukprot:TRINITY_DN456_c0_g1_i1.p1 TRINITY_DN456_c0_g1~~TRINITY_DN456_c0_g1_i1.p1  ORF type:complete len:230 (-),score=36.13 TRINITY_DN456_c0_g1_i1:225-914(-)